MKLVGQGKGVFLPEAAEQNVLPTSARHWEVQKSNSKKGSISGAVGTQLGSSALGMTPWLLINCATGAWQVPHAGTATGGSAEQAGSETACAALAAGAAGAAGASRRAAWRCCAGQAA